MLEWNKLVEANWEHWTFYKEMLEFSLQKSANSPITSYFYPFFYQQRLLKRAFVENMRILGDLTFEEINQFETLEKNYSFRYSYRYYKEHKGPYIWYYNILFLFWGMYVRRVAKRTSFPKIYKTAAPVFAVLGAIAVFQRISMYQLNSLVDLTQYVIEKRKAEVWLTQELIRVPALISFPRLKNQVFKAVKEVRQSESDEKKVEIQDEVMSC